MLGGSSETYEQEVVRVLDGRVLVLGHGDEAGWGGWVAAPGGGGRAERWGLSKGRGAMGGCKPYWRIMRMGENQASGMI